MALVLDSRFTKDQIFELYLNEIVLGQRGPFEIRGFGEGARIFFGKDVSNVTLAEAATLAGLPQQPSAALAVPAPRQRARNGGTSCSAAWRMPGSSPKTAAKAAAAEPLKVAARAFEDEAPYFVDYVSKLVEETNAGPAREGAAPSTSTPRSTCTCSAWRRKRWPKAWSKSRSTCRRRNKASRRSR